MSSNKIITFNSNIPDFFPIFLSHPITHARTLMQLGYEPGPTYIGHSFLSAIGYGNKVEKYPSILTYYKYMRNKIGIVGIFTAGLRSRILYWYISAITTDKILSRLKNKRNSTEVIQFNTETDLYEYVSEIINLTIARSVALILAYPLHVIMVRQMAEIMNDGVKELKLSSIIFNSFFNYELIFRIYGIYYYEGISSLYGGLKAKLIGEILTIWLTAGFVYAFNKYVLNDRVGNDIKNYSPNIGGLLVQMVTYRFTVLSTVMAIAGSKITGAVPLQSMLACYTYLSNKKAFQRGSSLLLRYVN